MSIKQASHIVRELGLHLVKEDGEYQVRVPGQPAATYHTDDLDDAVGTARLISRHP